MPIYEYRCNKCGSKFERLVAVSDSSKISCAGCGSDDTCKLFSTFGFASIGKASMGGACSSCSSSDCSACGK